LEATIRFVCDPATDEDLLKICDRDYIDFCKEYYQAASAGWLSYYENFSRYQSFDINLWEYPENLRKLPEL